MYSTTRQDYNPTENADGSPPPPPDRELLRRYDAMVEEEQLSWASNHTLIRRLGRGGQGVVYLTRRDGADGFTMPMAVKIFSPERFGATRQYDIAMTRIAKVAARVAQIQQDNLLDVHNFVDRNHIRLMVMEWIDGYDLRRLLVNKMLKKLQKVVPESRWVQINQVLLTAGPIQPRIKAGVAVAIVRDCLAGLAALHRERIVHGDIKPSNIMLKRTGNAKLIDIGSAIEMDDPPEQRTCTPTYAAPEVLEGQEATERSDLASLGYVLVELLSGRPPFKTGLDPKELLHAKRALPQKLPEILPPEVTCNELLMTFCRGLIAPDPVKRFPNAEVADLMNTGAAAFHRQLVKGDLASEYENEIRLWLRELNEADEDMAA
jgi:serine/threonine protein kinase